MNVCITEDNPTIREGLALLIDATEGLSCVGKFSSCEDMLATVDELQVDIYLQDIGLPGMSGIEGTTHLLARNPLAIVLMLTVYEDENNIFEALKAGASGYLLKKTPPAELIAAIHDAAKGGSPMSSPIARKVVTYFNKNSAPGNGQSTILTKQEIAILNSLAAGNSYKIIADEIFISIDTVRFHIRKIYHKLHARTQPEAVAKAIKQGLI